MPKHAFILPNQLNNFILNESSDTVHALLITERLEELIADGIVALKKKTQGCHFFYSFNIDIGKHAHRAIFDRVSFNGVSYFLLRKIAWMHNYGAALRWKTLDKVNDEFLNEFYADYGGYRLFDSSNTLVVQDDLSVFNRAIYYHGRALIPSSLQTDILYPESPSSLSMPLILVGPPGSGKTLIGMGLIQERAMTHCNNIDPNPLELCYVAESRPLVEQQKDNWVDFSSHHLTKKGNEAIRVCFYTVEDYAKEYAQSRNFEFLTGIAAHQLLSKFLGNELKDHQELYHNAWRIYLDYKEQRSFDESLYKEAGANNSFYTYNEQKEHHAKYIAFIVMLEQKRIFLCGISPLLDIKEQYHLTVIDEAQRINPALLQGFMLATEQCNTLIIGDPYQKGDSPFSSLDGLRALTSHCFKSVLPYYQLSSSLRVQPDVAKVLDNIVLLYNQLLGGKVDAVSYSCLQHEECPTQDRAVLAHVHFLQSPLPETSQTQFIALGTNAHAAALVLDTADKKQAGMLIDSHNVFTAEEVLGLEFSQVLLYLSKNTLKQFNDISLLMKELDIKPGQALAALQNKPAEKGSSRVAMQALLSDLLVALSRTQGALYVVCETPENARKLKYFIDWFKCCLGGEQADLQIESAYNSDDDWLHASNDFIQAGALIQAKQNLQSKLKLTDAQADAYIVQCKQHQSISTAAEMYDWLKLVRAAETKTELLEASNNDVALWEDLHVQLVQEGTPAIKLWLTQQESTEQLFMRPMNNGACLWINITLNHFDDLCALFTNANHPYKTLLARGFQYAKTTTNHLLSVCLALVAPKHPAAAEVKRSLYIALTQDTPELDMQLMKLLVANDYLSRFTKDDFFIAKMKTPQLAHVLFRYQTAALYQKYPNLKAALVTALSSDNGGYVTAAGAYQGHNLITCLLDSAFGLDFFEDKRSRDLIIKKWDNLFGKSCLGALLHLCQHEQGIKLLNKYVTASNDSCFNTLFVPIAAGSKLRTSAFSRLCDSNAGIAFINKHSTRFIKVLQKTNALFAPLTDGATDIPFYKLCSSTESMSILLTLWPACSAFIKKNPHVLFAPITANGWDKVESAFERLLYNKKGIIILKTFWCDFAAHIKAHPDLLFAPLSNKNPIQGMTHFYQLCSEVDKNIIGLPIGYWPDFIAYLTNNPQVLFTPIIEEGSDTGMSAFYKLCCSEEGMGFQSVLLPAISAYLNKNPDVLFMAVTGDGTETGMTAFYKLCSSAVGIHLMRKYLRGSFAYLEQYPDWWFVPVTGTGPEQGMTAFYRLCANELWISEALNTVWTIFSVNIKQHPALLFAPIIGEGMDKGMTPFYQLCRSNTGKIIIESAWSDFSAEIQSHPELLFMPVTSNGPENGMIPFYHLSQCQETRTVIDSFANELDKASKLQFLTHINVFLKVQMGMIEIAVIDWLEKLILQVKNSATFRFFSNTQPNTHDDNRIELKRDDLEYR